MLVKERMSRPVITIHPDFPMLDALNLMHEERVRRLPVVDKHGKLVGIVSEGDLLHAGPSAATTFSVYELNYLLSKITVNRLMTKEVLTVEQDTPLEEAARLMADNKIGGLPVVRNAEVVGIITETDLFKVFLELLGAREAGVRIAALVHNSAGELTKLTSAIFEAGGNILALGTFLGESSENREVTMKVAELDAETLGEVVQPLVERVIDLREQ
jgi:acetoin utilization protein AcuB